MISDRVFGFVKRQALYLSSHYLQLYIKDHPVDFRGEYPNVLSFYRIMVRTRAFNVIPDSKSVDMA